MITLKQNSPVAGDETAGYDVILDEEYTVQEFIAEIVSNKIEWGTISIKGEKSLDYRYGNIEGTLSKEVLSCKIDRVSAGGGWSRMDYVIYTK